MQSAGGSWRPRLLMLACVCVPVDGGQAIGSIVEDRTLEPCRATGQPRTAGTGGGGGGGWVATVCACAGGGCCEEHPATSAAGITSATSAALRTFLRQAIFSATSDIRSSIVERLKDNTTIGARINQRRMERSGSRRGARMSGIGRRIRSRLGPDGRQGAFECRALESPYRRSSHENLAFAGA